MRKRLASVLLLLLALSLGTDALGGTTSQRRKKARKTRAALSCWSARDCTGKKIDRRNDCHNCKNRGGKSLGEPGRCRNC